MSNRDEAAGRVWFSRTSSLDPHSTTKVDKHVWDAARRRVLYGRRPRTLCCFKASGEISHKHLLKGEDGQDARLTAPSPACEDEVA